MLSWPVLMLLQNTFASVYALQSRRLAPKYKQAHFQILAAVFGAVYVVFLGYAFLNIDQIDTAAALGNIGLLGATGLLFTIWTVLTFITFRYVDAAIGTLLSTINLISVVVVASIVINETLTLLQAAGSVLLIISFVSIGWVQKSKLDKRNWRVGLTLALIASICFGLAIASEKYLLDQMGAPTYAVFGIGAQMLPLALLALLYRRDQFGHFRNREFLRNVALMGFVRGCAGLLFVLSLVKADNASLIGMMSGLKIVLTAILAAIILKELTFIRRKIVAAIIASVGVGMMVW